MNHLILQNWKNVGAVLNTSSQAIKQNALAASKVLAKVTNITEQAQCVRAAQDLNALLKSTEQARTEIKAPVLELGKQIDSLAKTFSAELAAEVVRLNRLLTDFTRAEQERVQREAAAKQQERVTLAEELRKADAAFFEAGTPEEETKALATIGKLATTAAQVPQRAIAAPARVDGMAVSEPWEFEVLDITALYAARPDLCTLAVSRSATKAAIKAGMIICPGLRIWKETKVGVRACKPPKNKSLPPSANSR
jgi:hypothetical protein